MLFHILMGEQVGLAQGTHIVEKLEEIVGVGGHEHGLGLFEIAKVCNFNIPVLEDASDLQLGLGRTEKAGDNIVSGQTDVMDELDEVSGSFWKAAMEERLGEVLRRDVMETEFPATCVTLMVIAGSVELSKCTHVGGLKGIGRHFRGSFESQSRVGWLLRSDISQRQSSIFPVSVFWNAFFNFWQGSGRVMSGIFSFWNEDLNFWHTPLGPGMHTRMRYDPPRPHRFGMVF